MEIISQAIQYPLRKNWTMSLTFSIFPSGILTLLITIKLIWSILCPSALLPNMKNCSEENNSYVFKYCMRGSNQNIPFCILLFETNYFLKLQVSFSVKRSIISKHVQEGLYSTGSSTFWKFPKAHHVNENLIFLHCP